MTNNVREAILSRLHDADDPIGHADLVEAVEYDDGFDMGDVEETIDALEDEGALRDPTPEHRGPAWRVVY